MKDFKNKRMILFVTLTIIVVGVTVFNLYANSQINQHEDKKALQFQNDLLKEENEKLNERLEKVVPSAQEQLRKEKISAAEKFIEVAFTRDSKGYKERRKNAESIMNETVFSYFYPSEIYDLGAYKSWPTNIQLFLQNDSPEQKQTKVIADFTTISSSENQEEDKTRNVIQLTLDQEDGRWIVVELQEMILETL
ncbi:MerR family transcriptional regulator [Bacillus sp. JJ722]|uniref:MerR family transcriptional regulator n=1 Tax=Bacillus sp. JJ722 TaxID=3122973 RepID=UPI002FFFE482